MTTTSSVRMKLGPVEFECTASEEFLRDESPALIAGMAQLYKEHFTDSEVQGGPRATAGKNSHGGSSANGVTPALVELTTTSIAAKLNAKTGPDLVLAAAIRLNRLGKTTFTRTELIERMREAPTYFRQNYHKNLSQSINSLVGTQQAPGKRCGHLCFERKHQNGIGGASCSALRKSKHESTSPGFHSGILCSCASELTARQSL